MIETNTSAIHQPAGQPARWFFARSAPLGAKGVVMATRNEEFMRMYGVHPDAISIKMRSLNSANVGRACRAARSLKQSTDCFLLCPTASKENFNVVGMMGRQGLNPKFVSATGAREDLAQFLGARLALRNEFVLKIMAHMPGAFLLNKKFVCAIAGDTIACDRTDADIIPTEGFEINGFGNTFIDVFTVMQGHLSDEVSALLKPWDGIDSDSPLWNWQKAWARPLETDLFDEQVDFGGGPIDFVEVAE